MPEETAQAVSWALERTWVDGDREVKVTPDTPHALVCMVREYFNDNDVKYSTFSYDDLVPYLPQ